MHIPFLLKLTQCVPINGLPNRKSIKKAEKSPSFKASLATCAVPCKPIRPLKNTDAKFILPKEFKNVSSTYNVPPSQIHILPHL